jgi:hypothetical protein
MRARVDDECREFGSHAGYRAGGGMVRGSGVFLGAETRFSYQTCQPEFTGPLSQRLSARLAVVVVVLLLQATHCSVSELICVRKRRSLAPHSSLSSCLYIRSPCRSFAYVLGGFLVVGSTGGSICPGLMRHEVRYSSFWVKASCW